MEALALIIGEIIFATLAPFIAIVVELIGAALSALASLFTGRSSERDGPPAWAKPVGLTLAVLAALVFAAVLVVNFLFFEPAVRFVFERVENRTGIETRCDDIAGSLLSGRIQLGTCSIRRLEHPASTFDLKVAEVAIDLRMTSLLGTAKLDSARVVGLTGTVRRMRQPGEDIDTGRDRQRPRREFEAQHVQASDIAVLLAGTNPDGNDFEVPVKIASLDIKPLRSRLALFDVLFRGNATGSLAGAPFRLETTEIPDGRRTTWRAREVPIASFGAITGGALAWFSSGSVDVAVDDEWQRGDGTSIDMDWRLDFTDLEVAPPPGTGRVARFVTAPLTAFVNRFDGAFPLEFELLLNENQFEYRSSLSASGVWTAIGGATNRALELLGFDLSSAKRTGETLKEGAKSVLDKVRKPRDTAPEED